MRGFVRSYESLSEKIAIPSRRETVERRRGARIEHVPGGLQIVIPGWFGWGAIALDVLWLSWTAVVSGGEILRILHDKSHWPTSGLLIFWGSHVLTALVLLLWQLAGCEVIFIDGVTLTQRFQVFGLGWTRRFLLAEVRNLNVSSMFTPIVGTEWRQDKLRNSVSFSYRHKAYRLGWLLSYEAAVRVARAIWGAHPSVSENR